MSMNSKKFIAALMIAVGLLTTCGIDLNNIESSYAAQKAKKKAKRNKKSKRSRTQSSRRTGKSVYVHQCRKCGQIWEQYGLSGAMYGVFGPMMKGYMEGLFGKRPPNNWDCPMGGYCIWVRVKRR